MSSASSSSAVPLRGPLVGVSAVVVRAGAVLVGRRQGAHEADSWAFPGGKVDPGEHPRATVVRELWEETGLQALSIEPILWTSDIFAQEGLHFITLHHVVDAEGEVSVREPDKVAQWCWVSWDEVPEPRFAATEALLVSGWRPA